MDFFWWLLWLFYIAAYLYVVILIITRPVPRRQAQRLAQGGLDHLPGLRAVPDRAGLRHRPRQGHGRARAARRAATHGRRSRTTTSPRRPPPPRTTSPRRRSCWTPGDHQPGRVRRAQEQGARATSTSARSRSWTTRRADASSLRHPLFFFVPVVGLEPTRPFGQPILSRSRLPFRHTGPARPRTTIP